MTPLAHSTSEAASALGHRLLEAFETNDEAALRSCCTEDAVFWNNLDAIRTLDEVVAVHNEEMAVVPDLHFEDVRIQAMSSGYVQQATIRGTTIAGAAVEIPLCAVVTVEGGLIARLEEYISLSHVKPLLAAMQST